MESTVQWYQHCQEVASQKISGITCALGGIGVVVHIDETFIKQKMNRSKGEANDVWVLGLYDTNLRKGLVERIPNRSADVLIPIIQRLVLPGTTIHTDEWEGYSQLSSLGYIHNKFKRSSELVNPITGTHKNSIVGFLANLKRRITMESDSEDDVMCNSLDEFLYRHWFDMSVTTPMRNWDLFLQHIRDVYPV
ncbi:unnamed protein product [Trichobilharzia szidati]|nr:unnamed protein product [Trichobilharzia szidati]